MIKRTTSSTEAEAPTGKLVELAAAMLGRPLGVG
jgi:hypothetical protein